MLKLFLLLYQGKIGRDMARGVVDEERCCCEEGHTDKRDRSKRLREIKSERDYCVGFFCVLCPPFAKKK